MLSRAWGQQFTTACCLFLLGLLTEWKDFESEEFGAATKAGLDESLEKLSLTENLMRAAGKQCVS